MTEKKVVRCKHCGQELYFYESKCDYCLPCFDLYNKGREEAKKEFSNKLEQLKKGISDAKETLHGNTDWDEGFDCALSIFEKNIEELKEK